jgi:hypothetical protein
MFSIVGARLTGLTVGLLGSGGSILSVPISVYLRSWNESRRHRVAVIEWILQIHHGVGILGPVRRQMDDCDIVAIGAARSYVVSAAGSTNAYLRSCCVAHSSSSRLSWVCSSSTKNHIGSG